MSKNQLEQLRARYLRDESALIRRALDAHGWVQSRAARWLRCPETSLRRAVQRHPALAKRLIDGRWRKRRPLGGPGNGSTGGL